MKIMKLVACCILLMFLIAGCAGLSYYKDAQSSLDRGRYESAVVYLEEAIEKEPYSERYKTALVDAKVKAYEKEYENIVKLEKQLKLYTALKSLLELEKYALNPLQKKYIDEKRKEWTSKISQAEAKCDVAINYINQKDWHAAKTLIAEAYSINNEVKKRDEALRKLKKSGHEHYICLANKQIGIYNWDNAEENLQEAEKYIPYSADVKKMRNSIDLYKNAESIYFDAENELKNNNFDKSINLLMEAYRIHPERQRYGSRLDEVKTNYAKRLYIKGCDSLSKNALDDALKLFSECCKLGVNVDGIENSINLCKRGLSEKYAKIGERAYENKDYASALINLVISAGFSEPSENSLKLISHCKEYFADKAAVNIGILPFRSRPDEGLSQRIESEVYSYFSKTKKSNFKLHDKSEMQTILKKYDFSLEYLYGMGTVQNIPRISELDMIIVGSVDDFNISSSKDVIRMGVSEYQNGII